MNSFRTPEPVVLKIFKRSEMFSSYSDPIFIVEMSSSRYNSLDFSKTFERTSCRYNQTVEIAFSRYNRQKTFLKLPRPSTTSLTYVRRLKLLHRFLKANLGMLRLMARRKEGPTQEVSIVTWLQELLRPRYWCGAHTACTGNTFLCTYTSA